MLSIGEFSRLTGLSAKALRLYHERGLLMPERVDESTGYRYYRLESLDKARTIAQLRAMTFSLDEIQNIVGECEDDAEIIDFLQRKAKDIAQKLGHLENVASSIESVINNEKEALAMTQNNQFAVEEKHLEGLLVASIRWKGAYSETGTYLTKIYKAYGRYTCGKALSLYFDEEYVEEGAEIESCVPVRKGSNKGDFRVRQLEGGKCISLIHKGPYSEISRSYEKLIRYAKDKSIEVELPSREVYRKGPGMIFKGNPKNYLTEIQFMLKG